jgi:hypothetical protein
LCIEVDVRKSTADENSADRPQGTTRAVNVGEDLRGVTLVGQSGQCTGTAIYTGDTDGYDGDQNDDIHEAVKTFQSRIFANKHKWRGIDIDVATGTKEAFVVVADEKADEEKTEDVEASANVSDYECRAVGF